MAGSPFRLSDASRRAAEILGESEEMTDLYGEAVRRFGEGELRMEVLEIISRSLGDEKLRDEVCATDENMLSFCCGVWVQFLLTEIAGVKREKLRSMARKVFREKSRKRPLN